MAYNSEQLTLQPPKEAQGFLRRVLTKGQVFPFTKANETIALSLAGEITPSYHQELEKEEGKSSYWNEERLNSETFSNWTQLYLFIVGLAKAALFFFLPLAYFLIFIGLIFGSGGWSARSETFYGLTLYITFPFLLIYGHFKLVSAGHLFLAPFLKSKRVYSLNRQTGMVTLFKKGNKERFSHPFIEFDCVLMSAPSPQGHLNYNLMLVHRYHDYSVGVPIGNLIGSNERVAEYYRLWNMIQRYMDISQPMPDILVLEPARERDPTTAAYDKQTGRNPRYWRDMSDEEYQQTLKKIAEQQKNQPDSGPALNIFSPS
ncbi:hypothetical protein [Vibrio fluvialis]|uniref:hypothetical protein n=1 Tax=Vibrio fluvialis TaxID=676 RepID=UPI001302319E|nr:hypothetical protein [Vibrio fluvialis]EKO3511930.1 hypothetical protein [Vibrio fluvialis]MCE7606769.1 hypothetical protein [Vibrio fluvialis]